MAKRFIDTNMFSDSWFSELSKDCKLFFVYYITGCDHAGILRLNRKLFEFQTDIKDIDNLIKELGNSLITVKKDVFFMPKFIKFQYPNFPKSKVKQQESAIKILSELGMWNIETNSYRTVPKELVKTYDNESVSDNVNDVGIVPNIVPPKKTFIRVGIETHLLSPSEYYKKNLSASFENWQMQNKADLNLALPTFSKMDAEYIGYDFTDDNHVRRTFLYCLEKIKKQPQADKPKKRNQPLQ